MKSTVTHNAILPLIVLCGGLSLTGCSRNLPATIMDTEDVGGVEQVVEWFLAENAEVREMAGPVLDMKIIFTTEYAKRTPVLSSLFGGFQEALLINNYKITGTQGEAFAVVERLRTNGKAWRIVSTRVMNENVYRAEFSNPAGQTGDYRYIEGKEPTP